MKKLVLLLAVVFSASLFSCGNAEKAAEVAADSVVAVDTVAAVESCCKADSCVCADSCACNDSVNCVPCDSACVK